MNMNLEELFQIKIAYLAPVIRLGREPANLISFSITHEMLADIFSWHLTLAVRGSLVKPIQAGTQWAKLLV